MRVLLIGASGQLGTALVRAFADVDLVQTAHRHAGSCQLSVDLADGRAVREVLDGVGPQVVLLAGAMCHVDGCEGDAVACRRINVEGPALVAKYGRRQGARIVYFSTDHVFADGEEPYGESDPVRPLNTYAASKAQAEAAIRELIPDHHLILRTSWLYGPDIHRRNFALRLVDRLSRGETVRVPADQWGSPTYTSDLSTATRFLLDADQVGTFHATGPDYLTRIQLAQKICETFLLDSTRLDGVPTRVLGQSAPRPLRVRLDCGKLAAAGVPPFRGVAAGLGSLRGVESPAVATGVRDPAETE